MPAVVPSSAAAPLKTPHATRTMQHPLAGATCVALPHVDMCPQLSCALTFMYLQQIEQVSDADGLTEPRRLKGC
ncbi:hypothetical protein AAFF_G00270880 [Aldrovandia affinis]|uniref:Uncharacterized protein n=1 Tax=Aldrovandia affinis TaxID=143900 RepID=A0AAD7RB07_9TELE|nr:hypothetical protein AAFF_G00270880 [Aldrovandia affinis]